MARFFAPPAPKQQLPSEKVPKVFNAMRWKVFLGAFLGYAGYYLVRPFRPVSGIVILIFPVYSLFPGYGISIRNSYLCVLLIT